MYDFSSTTHLLLRFAVFDSQLRKRDVDFSGHQLDGQEMFGEWFVTSSAYRTLILLFQAASGMH